MLSIGYFADGEWGHRTFNRLIEDSEIRVSFICVRYDHRDPILVKKAEKYGIDLLYTININSNEFINKLKDYNCDLFVSMSFNQIFKKKIINLPPFKTINCHAGKLPYYRGRNILNWALINDEKEFGITVHYMDEGIDTGDIILQRIYPISDDDNYATLLNVAYEKCAEILYDSIKLIQDNKVNRIPQESIDPIGMYCGRRQQGDEIIDWNSTSREIFNFVRALCYPGPKAATFLKGKKMLINNVKMIVDAKSYINIPGQVIGKKGKKLLVKTKDTFVEIEEYDYNDVIRVGDRLMDIGDETI